MGYDAYVAAQNIFSTFLNKIDPWDITDKQAYFNPSKKLTIDDFIAYYTPGSFLLTVKLPPVDPCANNAPNDPCSAKQQDIYTEMINNWIKQVVSMPDSFLQGGKPLNPAPTASASCNLQSQVGSTCNYLCSGAGKAFSTYTTTLAALGVTPKPPPGALPTGPACPLASITTTCPNLIVIKGLSPSTAKVTACSN